MTPAYRKHLETQIEKCNRLIAKAPTNGDGSLRTVAAMMAMFARIRLKGLRETLTEDGDPS